MKVSELIDELQKLDPNTLIVLSSDGEGNNYSPLAGMSDVGTYTPDTTWSGSFRSADDIYDDEDFYYDDEDDEDYEYEEVEDESVPAIIFWPIN